VTDARYEACMDIYNAITFAAMNHGIVPLCQPQLILNFDATQYKVEYVYGKLVAIINWQQISVRREKKERK
jgi:hypothetical protein